jgi:hypothetical protein
MSPAVARCIIVGRDKSKLNKNMQFYFLAEVCHLYAEKDPEKEQLSVSVLLGGASDESKVLNPALMFAPPLFSAAAARRYTVSNLSDGKAQDNELEEMLSRWKSVGEWAGGRQAWLTLPAHERARTSTTHPIASRYELTRTPAHSSLPHALACSCAGLARTCAQTRTHERSSAHACTPTRARPSTQAARGRISISSWPVLTPGCACSVRSGHHLPAASIWAVAAAAAAAAAAVAVAVAVVPVALPAVVAVAVVTIPGRLLGVEGVPVAPVVIGGAGAVAGWATAGAVAVELQTAHRHSRLPWIRSTT